MSPAAQQQPATIKQHYVQQQEVLTASFAEANQVVIAAKRDFRECESGQVRHRVAVAEAERRMFEISKAEGELRELKTAERKEIDEAWREFDKQWSSLSARFPDIEIEMRYEGKFILWG